MKKLLLWVIFLFIVVSITVGDEKNKSENELNRGTVTDIEGNVYQTVKIGNQWWMVENLKVTRYRNGAPIPNVTDKTAWTNLSSGAYCVYDNNESYANSYGYLYNWFAVNDKRKIAPIGWHVPTEEEWQELESFLGISQTELNTRGWRGTDEGSKLKAANGWHGDGNGTNESGFTALPTGYRANMSGYFEGEGIRTYLASSTKYSSNTFLCRALAYYKSTIYRSNLGVKFGFSVRCIKDESIIIKADFEGNPISGPVPLEVKFKDKSTQPITAYDWDFGDQSTSQEKNPLHTYLASGLYRVSLNVHSNKIEKSETKKNYILCLPALPPVHTDTIFFENFENTLSSLWQFKNPDHWDIQNNNNSLYISTTNYSHEDNDRLGEYALINILLDDIYTFQFKVKSLENLRNNIAADYCGIFGFKDPENYYYFMLNACNMETCIYRIDSTGRHLLQSRYGNWIQDNEYHTITITGVDDKLWVYHDLIAVFYCDSIDNNGKIGIGSYNDASMFDDVLILQRSDAALPLQPGQFRLEQNYPNPFNTSTSISYSMNISARIRLTVYDLRGRKIKTLVEANQDADTYSVQFQEPNLASGIYYYKLSIDNKTKTKKMVLLK